MTDIISVDELDDEFQANLIDFIKKNCKKDFYVEVCFVGGSVIITKPVNKLAIHKHCSNIDKNLVEMCNFDRTLYQIELEDNIAAELDDIRDLV